MGSWTDGSLDDDLLLLPILPWLIPYSPLFWTSHGCCPLVLFVVHAQSSCTVCAQNTLAFCTVCAQVMANSSQQGVLVLIPSRSSVSSTALPAPWFRWGFAVYVWKVSIWWSKAIQYPSFGFIYLKDWHINPGGRSFKIFRRFNCSPCSLIPSRPSASSTALPCSLICLLVLTFLDSGTEVSLCGGRRTS